jgi:hypothetical protein
VVQHRSFELLLCVFATSREPKRSDSLWAAKMGRGARDGGREWSKTTHLSYSFASLRLPKKNRDKYCVNPFSQLQSNASVRSPPLRETLLNPLSIVFAFFAHFALKPTLLPIALEA